MTAPETTRTWPNASLSRFTPTPSSRLALVEALASDGPSACRNEGLTLLFAPSQALSPAVPVTLAGAIAVTSVALGLPSPLSSAWLRVEATCDFAGANASGHFLFTMARVGV